VAAPKNTKISSLESIGKELAVAAFAAQSAGGGERKKSEADYLQELVKDLQGIKQDGKDLQTWWDERLKEVEDQLGVKIGELVENHRQAVEEWLFRKLEEVKSTIRQSAAETGRGFRSGLLGGVGGLFGG
jgi:hypothetical protein